MILQKLHHKHATGSIFFITIIISHTDITLSNSDQTD
jgi:hypothetical protein